LVLPTVVVFELSAAVQPTKVAAEMAAVKNKAVFFILIPSFL
jgi:hypothetical protein